MASEQTVDWGAPGRVDGYWFALVDPFTLQEVDTIQLDESASSVTWSYSSENMGQATLDLAEGNYFHDGRQMMVRVVHSATIGDFVGSWYMGTFFVANVANNALHHHAHRKLTCYGPLYRFTQDVLEADWVRHKGDNVVEGIRWLVESNGGKLRVDTGVDTSSVHTHDFINVAGFNKGELLRTFAGWIGCEITCDYTGEIVLRPYESPYTKAPVYTFEDGENCVYLPGVNWEVNREEPINRVVAYFSREKKQDDDPYPLSDSVSVDVPDSDGFSYRNSGRHRTQVIQVTEPCDHATLTAQAQRALDQRSAGEMCITIEHANVPFLQVGDCVRYINSHDDTNPNLVSTGIIEEMSVQSLGPFCMTKTKLKLYR